ncbi:hypothetical protein [Pedomonas mirosovicensis]|uniref:hypothetical protein n=1 Tax=Pedomonas mirosovicensis TaxID=2908641 RepID=UPI002169A715|nr:hypothetical protein [Pedomonas mirosovicensis]MCH8686471.1 hypothetical protein [Pedomonas mirosovicensis]
MVQVIGVDPAHQNPPFRQRRVPRLAEVFQNVADFVDLNTLFGREALGVHRARAEEEAPAIRREGEYLGNALVGIGLDDPAEGEQILHRDRPAGGMDRLSRSRSL